MLNSNKRKIPTSATLLRRNSLYEMAARFTPIPPDAKRHYPIGLEPGNKKTGQSGKIFDHIFVFNLPIRVTCPGASIWCTNHCYNSDDREDVFPMDSWRRNWWWAINDPGELERRICQQLSKENGKTAVRIHSCGDFFSTAYIQMWIDISKRFPNICFWGYTRSWIVPNLAKKIENLTTLENVNIFASWDKSMPVVPVGWRKSIVVSKNNEVELYQRSSDAHICLEQYGAIRCCADCAFCIHSQSRDVIFILH